ncbi:MAG: hypothetical protein AAFX87_05425 [Bacteroidota bacterium]
MFDSLPHTLKSFGLPADVRTLLLLQKSFDKGLINTLGDTFLVLKSIVVKDPEMIGPFTQAYYKYFLDIDIEPGQRLDDAISKSDAFKSWKENFLKENPEHEDMDMQSLVDRFLDEVHITTYDINEVVKGEDILAKDNPDLEDKDPDSDAISERRNLEKGADYSNIDLDELMRRMERVRQQQKVRHSGGSHWVGTGGISPYGHSGAAKGGIRVGGQGGGRMARKVLDDPRYFPVDLDSSLRDDNIDAALAAMKGVFEESADMDLDVPKTIKTGLKRGGLFLPEEKDVITENMQIILMIDNGGYSMDYHIRPVTELFKKMKTRFAHDLKTFYFHNTIYDKVYTNERRSEYIGMDKFLDHDPNYTVMIVGDAAMAPYELSERSVNNWMTIAQKFKKVAWLNPEPQRYWDYTLTIQVLSRIINMYPLTLRGIEQAVLGFNKTKLRK